MGIAIYNVQAGVTRWVQPFEDRPFRAQIRRLTDEEEAAIFDRHRIYPGSPKNTMAKLNAAMIDAIRDTLIAWEHPESVFANVGADFPCEGENKLRIMHTMVRYDADEEPQSLWKVCQRKMDEADEIEIKN